MSITPEQLAALAPFLKALEVNDADSLGACINDSYVLFTATGSWGDPAPVTLGDLRRLAKAFTVLQAKEQ